MEKMLVSPSPQIRDNISTSKVMTHVLVALCPALAMSAYVFGGRALMLTGFCMITALIWERLCNLIMKRPDSTKDVSALVTGMLLAFHSLYNALLAGCYRHICCYRNRKAAFWRSGTEFCQPCYCGKNSSYACIHRQHDPLGSAFL